MSVSFKDQVVLVTGSSRGLGRAFAECIAAAGGHVVVNSTGRDDSGDRACDEIATSGGLATHIACRVENAEDLVGEVLARCGRLDAVIHNGGFIEDKTIRKMTNQQWDDVLDVHLGAAFRLTRAAWPHFQQQGGRIVLISSSAGLYGNFGQANYAAAKMGMVGLARTIALEGARENIRCNVVAPFGATEMNSAGWDDSFKSMIETRHVAPLVAWLAHPDCDESGGLFEASAGSFKKVRLERSTGLVLSDDQITIDDVAAGWDQIVDFSSSEHPANMGESLELMYRHRGQR